MNYEELLQEAYDDGLYIIENAIFESSADGLINNDVIGINAEIRSSNERACILAEELGHYYTSVGNILDQSESSNRKQECRARMWAYNKMIGLVGLIDCFEAGCRNRYEFAEHLGVTEEFLEQAVEAYRKRYGEFVQVGDYMIYFEPYYGVAKML